MYDYKIIIICTPCHLTSKQTTESKESVSEVKPGLIEIFYLKIWPRSIFPLDYRSSENFDWTWSYKIECFCTVGTGRNIIMSPKSIRLNLRELVQGVIVMQNTRKSRWKFIQRLWAKQSLQDYNLMYQIHIFFNVWI